MNYLEPVRHDISCDKIIIVSRITVWFFAVFARHARSQVELCSWIDRHGKLTIRLKCGLVKLFNKPGHFFIKQSMSRPEIQCQSRHNRWVVNFTWFLKGTKLVTRSVRQYGQKTLQKPGPGYFIFMLNSLLFYAHKTATSSTEYAGIFSILIKDIMN